jgi:hypothetical protein
MLESYGLIGKKRDVATNASARAANIEGLSKPLDRDESGA